jgi:hypothetical protein
MATGTDTAPGGLGVPLYGDSEIKQRTAATDILTITGASGQTGDFFVCRVDGDTEVMSVEDSGRANVRQFAVADAAGTLWRVAMTNN